MSFCYQIMKCLFVGNVYNWASGGKEVTKVNKQLLCDSFKDVEIIEYPYDTISFCHKIVNTLRGCVLGLTPQIEKKILKRISDIHFDYVFVNTSMHGKLVPKIKRINPTCKIITFFHDIEVCFVWSGIKNTKNIGALLTLLSTYYNEKRALKYSDITICLNEREVVSMKKMYGCKPTLVMPISLPDRYDANRLSPHINKRKIALFVGSNFYPNYYGIKWFIENVIHHLNVDLLVVGSNFENSRKELEIYPNVKIIGTVDDIDYYYYHSDFLVSPIFSGGGMKTKTAEALMFGKYIFGTDESFMGYKLDYDKVGGLCNTAGEFIEKINRFCQSERSTYNMYARTQFLEHFEYSISLKKFKSVL